jgi:uncharacterized protein with NRDE domain
MCLVALALDVSERFPLVVVANRDEFFDRPSAPLEWWSPEGGPLILGGRDLVAGGTWLGLTHAGRLALVTNVRDGSAIDLDAPSRGEIVLRWLRPDASFDALAARIAEGGYGGVNVIAADLARGECFHVSNRGGSTPTRLTPGIYGLSNASLDTPWPKVVTLKRRLEDALRSAESARALATSLRQALLDDRMEADDALPDTGVGLAHERILSAAFIRSPAYGTRCSTVVIREKRHAFVYEWSYNADADIIDEREVVIETWPASGKMAPTARLP